MLARYRPYPGASCWTIRHPGPEAQDLICQGQELDGRAVLADASALDPSRPGVCAPFFAPRRLRALGCAPWVAVPRPL